MSNSLFIFVIIHTILFLSVSANRLNEDKIKFKNSKKYEKIIENIAISKVLNVCISLLNNYFKKNFTPS